MAWSEANSYLCTQLVATTLGSVRIICVPAGQAPAVAEQVMVSVLLAEHVTTSLLVSVPRRKVNTCPAPGAGNLAPSPGLSDSEVAPPLTGEASVVVALSVNRYWVIYAACVMVAEFTVTVCPATMVVLSMMMSDADTPTVKPVTMSVFA